MKRVIAILGPTATGKTALAMRFATRLPGAVIVSADSRQVYRGMDIGTAKPSQEDRERVRHELIDVVEPDQPFSLAEYQRLAYQAIDAAERPFLVGGTGLYARAVLDGFQLPDAPPDEALRQAHLPKEALLERLMELEPQAAETADSANPYRLLRAVERAGRPTFPSRPRYDSLRIGLEAPRDALYQRSDRRVDEMLAAGWLDEARRLLQRFPADVPALTGLGYSELGAYLAGRMAFDEAVSLIKRRTRQFIKRQLTWFRRDSAIQWFDITQPGWIAQATELVGEFWRLPQP